MTRLHHRDKHLLRGYQLEIIDSSIKTINRLVLPYIEAHFRGDWEFIGELFKVNNYIFLTEQIQLLLNMCENHKEYLEMTKNTLRTLKMSYDCHQKNVTDKVTIDNLIVIIDEQNERIDQLQNDKPVTNQHYFTPLQFNMIVDGETSWVFFVFHALYGIPRDGYYDPTCLAKILAGTANGNEECDCNCN